MDVETGYSLWSHTYDGDVNRTRDLDAVALRASGLEREGRDIVELGPGTGKNSVWLAEGARTLVGLDLSDAMLAHAREQVPAPHVRFAIHDLQTPWPLGAQRADLIAGNLVLEHIRDVGFVFREAARVLRPHGELYISELHPFRQLAGSGAKLSEAADGRIEAYVHSVAEYVNSAIEAGFTVGRIDEWRDSSAAEDAAALPRLLTIRYSLSCPAARAESAARK